MLTHKEIPLTTPYFDDSEIEAVARVIRSGWVTQGPKVAEFEQAVADYVGARYGIATTSCTTAMHLSLVLRGVGEGDEVIMPSFTCPATANAVCHSRAIPAFVDIDPRTFNLDPASVADAINPRTRAIMAIHQFGLPADMDPINKLARKHGLVVIEDAGVALGSVYQGKRVGSLGAPTCFSFHGRKIITMGEGGMLTTSDDAFAERARIVRSHGASVSDLVRHQAKGKVLQTYEELGYNFRMTDIQAAIGLEQMKKLPHIVEQRRRLARRYDKRLMEIPEVEPPHVPSYAEHSYQSYIIRLTPQCRLSRDELLHELASRGVSCRHTLSCHSEPYFRQICGEVHLPITDEIVRTAVCLPLFPTMTEEEQDYVVESLQEVLTASVRG
jgi:perosamine synthetase